MVRRRSEGTVGETAEVWVHDKGGGPLRLRGTVVIEDLTNVLTTIASRSGANGPMNPVTQYILAKAADHLAERLTADALDADRDQVPRILSSALGHQPFIEQVLGMSQHQMLRRWPMAYDWYADVLHYMLRPGRFTKVHAQGLANLDEWASGPFGELLRLFGDLVVPSHQPAHIVRVAEALYQLWPEYGPVREVHREYSRQIRELWIPLYYEAARRYGLLIRPEVDIEMLAWCFNALQSRETQECLGQMPDGVPMEPGVRPGARHRAAS